jgi:uncharacterized protein YqeY
LIAELRAAPTAAREDRDTARTLLHSTLLSDIRNRAIELGHAASDAEAVEVVRRGIPRGRESIEVTSAFVHR